MDKTVATYVILNWTTVFFYVLGTTVNVYGTLFRKEKPERFSYWITSVGLACHSASLLFWWRVVGHGPYMAPSEVLSADAWITLCMFLLFMRFYPRIKPASIVVFPVVFLMVGLATMSSPGIRTLPPTFGGVWLVFHIAFYKIALGTLVIALAFSIFYLLKDRPAPAAWLQRLPDLPNIDLFAYRFAGFGFIFWAIGMLAGSIWAYKSWGRYWGWDPVETWSLMTWLIFGFYLHLRRFFRMNGRRASWFFIFGFLIALVAQFLTSHMGTSIHAEYFR
ncbi:Cytochrome c biogenesis protein CcsA [Geobacteraceae bacterium]|nr:Cytochrome c biogenesis protein CcsA [Geobacteraceae bacterium]